MRPAVEQDAEHELRRRVEPAGPRAEEVRSATEDQDEARRQEHELLQ